MSEDNEKKDVFHESIMDSISNEVASQQNEVIILNNKQELLIEIQRRLEKGETQWDKLKGLMENGLTERFMRVISEMPDKDFVRNYLKLLEHFKPKLVRASEGEVDKPDTIINIQTIIMNPETGEKEILDITNLQNNNEDV
jgi:hypothetical protein